MAVKDVVNYYAQVESQYHEMLEDVKDYEQAFNTGEITEEKYEEALKLVDSIKANYERLSYIMFLLTKRKKYKKRTLTENVEISENAELLRELKRKDK